MIEFIDAYACLLIRKIVNVTCKSYALAKIATVILSRLAQIGAQLMTYRTGRRNVTLYALNVPESLHLGTCTFGSDAIICWLFIHFNLRNWLFICFAKDIAWSIQVKAIKKSFVNVKSGPIR